MIRLQRVSKAFGGVPAVRDVSLEVAAGAAFALLGPSGSGKTTLLRLVAGLERPDGGEVHLDGALASSPAVLVPPHRRRVGMVFQQPALWPHMTVAENVGFGLAGREKGAAGRRVAAMLERVGLAGLEGRYPQQLSGGQAQRVALARALAPRPAILLLDEPFANLDEALVAQMTVLVAEMLAGGDVTLVYVSHDERSARALCSRAARMEAGRLAQWEAWDGGASRPGTGR